jgi:hypothetical protein
MGHTVLKNGWIFHGYCCECHNQMVALGDGTCFPKKSPLATDDVRIFLEMGWASEFFAKKSHANLTMAHSYINIYGDIIGYIYITWSKTLIIYRHLYQVGGDWNHGILNDFPIQLGMENHPNWGVGQPPTRYVIDVSHTLKSLRSHCNVVSPWPAGWPMGRGLTQKPTGKFWTFGSFEGSTQTLELLGGSRVHQCPLPTDWFGAVSLSFQKGSWLAHKTPAVHCSGDP